MRHMVRGEFWLIVVQSQGPAKWRFYFRARLSISNQLKLTKPFDYLIIIKKVLVIVPTQAIKVGCCENRISTSYLG